ncbi:MAG: hypothetical protein LBU83_04455 [Bacteroidales bacterium]|jgi:hypothetical protein|nr:hypothetical protein [Bacteroidales bacterium]
MSQNNWYDTFMDILSKKYPKQKQLISALMDLLALEREAVYRRLRKEVVFSIHEIVAIASAWNISLDEITGINSGNISFQMKAMNYLEPSEEEANFLRYIIQSISFLKNFPETEFMDICNKIPRQLLAGYPYLNRFYLFKWMHQYNNESDTVTFSKITVSKEKKKIDEEYYHAIKQVPNSNFIFDRNIFEYLVQDIQYFCSIYLITDQEKEFIKKDLLALLNYLLEVANKGCYPESQNKVNLYISQLKIDTSYSYTYTPEVNICYIHVFEKFEIYSYNSEMVSNFMTWMQLKKRSAIQISEVDEKHRIDFFTKQQKIIENL